MLTRNGFALLMLVAAACSSTKTTTNDSSPDTDAVTSETTATGDVAANDTTTTAATDTPASDATGTATVTGTLDGGTFTPMSAIALKGANDPNYPGQVSIFFSNEPNLCSLEGTLTTTGASKANMTLFGFVLGDTTSTAVVTVGTYGAGAGAAFQVQAGWDAWDATCTWSGYNDASSETVTLTGIGEVYTGSFDVSFANGDHVTGTFSAPLCTLPVYDAAGASDASTCMQ